jgi:alkanesulfonate monooxygenase SsuD/methylene tetrahydromethanopterin reductase-like flavin-dependent oxidoreductase (luciferase family)
MGLRGIGRAPEADLFLRSKKTLAFYVSVGKIYREFLAKNGFKNETNNIFDEFKKSGFKSNYELVSDSMLQSLCISGNSEECKNQLQKFYETGIDLPIIQFNPVGDASESLELLKKTFLDD